MKAQHISRGAKGYLSEVMFDTAVRAAAHGPLDNFL